MRGICLVQIKKIRIVVPYCGIVFSLTKVGPYINWIFTQNDCLDRLVLSLAKYL